MNLIVNARDAMPEGGTLTIATRNAAVPDDTGGRYPRMPPGRYVTIAVTDTGHGMDEETRNHAFEPFYTTKEVGRGTGLGLATVYGIVKQSDGYVWIDSEPGRGTTVTIYLPRVDEAAEPRGAPANTHHGLRGVETILLVEDDDAVRSVARRVLERHGYTVLEARSGREGIEVARQHHGTIHLLVTDLVMPEMSGRRSAEHLAVMQPEMKVLYMSGYPQRGAGREWVLEPDVAFLQKPFTVQSLAEKVREVLDSG
jgi:CheY-like chemotaxis protein